MDVAAAVDSHRRDGARRWWCVYVKDKEEDGREQVRSARAQHRVVFVDDRDILDVRRMYSFEIKRL